MTILEVADFAARHGLTEKSAKIVLMINGPSKARCDPAGAAFKVALIQRVTKNLSDRLKVD
ncbi:hypothetical protein EN925_07195 [Mesorhizobium sp. M7A.F.Ca.US.006.04.2.1]|uniref:hypothetical protein n=1 Tax=unclassified Mesorhizobium TaxID=325217 RepID=UPI000FCC497C|nr:MULTISPECIES: hypothetical protein [unclassified Mesorhizobium]RUX76907.1 hypothetical protein EN990_07730 [Mesorhizobium sp. M7A.F.Ca.US.005.03.1.1]RUY09571.1 hypothetical protein EN991_29035 [Mesorhizobium sp. M7A.F.Ca.US.005.03.2.1]RVA93968.1 hypothetical protein EN925_07195 [Mesorhizobium sp. M7A.F.Ca.US.006.04.2.1]